MRELVEDGPGDERSDEGGEAEGSTARPCQLGVPTDGAVRLDRDLEHRLESMGKPKKRPSKEERRALEDSVALWVEGLGRSDSEDRD